MIELGCGEGIVSRQLADEKAKRVDLSAALLSKAKVRERAEKRGIEYIEGSFTNLKSLPDHSFDQVISVMALMDSPDLQQAYNEVFRVLKPGGHFFFVIRHPSTNRDGKKKIEDKVLQTKSYFSEKPFSHTVQFNDLKTGVYTFQSRHYPRTMSSIVNPLIKAGFSVVELDEPMPSPELVQYLPRLKTWQQEPFCLMVHAVKPLEAS